LASLPPVRPIGKWERLAAERNERELALARKGHPRGFYFDPVAAERPIHFIERYCKHHKGEWAGQPLLLEGWQKEQLRQAFGWKRADHFRRYRSIWDEEPRKNGKTEKAAGVGCYLLVGDNEPGAEIYATATKREQALILHSAASAMVRASPELRRFVKVSRHNLSCDRLGSKFEPLSADYNTLDGLSPSGDLRDEVHAWKDHALSAVLDTAMGARRQPMTFEITTAGTYDPESVGWQHHNVATKVLDGTVEDDSALAMIYAADEGDDPFDPATWWKANPNLGVSLKLDYLAKQAAKAKREPSFLNDFLRLHLNVWPSQVTRRIPIERWNACDATRINEDDLAGRDCFAGMDLATKLDLTALVLLFPHEDGSCSLLCRFWLPESTVGDYGKKGQRYWQQWADEGWLKTTPGDVVDYDFIRAEVNELGKKFRIQEIAFDPWGATQIATQLGGDGFTMVECRQGYKTLSEPFKEFEARIFSKRLRHGGNPILRYCVSNVAVDTDAAGNLKPAKDKSMGRIDGVVAATMALSRCIVSVAPSQPKVWFID
jgi:phage terminase large subunit-like protein